MIITAGHTSNIFIIKTSDIDSEKRTLFQVSKHFGPKLVERTFDLTFEFLNYELVVKLECDSGETKIIGEIDDLVETEVRAPLPLFFFKIVYQSFESIYTLFRSTYNKRTACDRSVY